MGHAWSIATALGVSASRPKTTPTALPRESMMGAPDEPGATSMSHCQWRVEGGLDSA